MRQKLTLALLFMWVGLEGAAPRSGHMPSLQEDLKRVAASTQGAVVAVMAWPKNFPNEIGGVTGSAFFINEDGYFLTAAHVLSGFPPERGTLTVVVIQKTMGGQIGLHFEVIEKDTIHDIALCRAIGFQEYWKRRDPKPPDNPGFYLGTLKLKGEKPPVGTIIALAGFPLGSWNPTFQVGIVSATETINPNLPGVPAGRKPLLQIGVTANKGNSGSPVIEVDSGEVIGIIIQEIPAPMLSNVPELPFAQNSGVALAAPAEWAIELLRKHQITSSN